MLANHPSTSLSTDKLDKRKLVVVPSLEDSFQEFPSLRDPEDARQLPGYAVGVQQQPTSYPNYSHFTNVTPLSTTHPSSSQPLFTQPILTAPGISSQLPEPLRVRIMPAPQEAYLPQAYQNSMSRLNPAPYPAQQHNYFRPTQHSTTIPTQHTGMIPDPPAEISSISNLTNPSPPNYANGMVPIPEEETLAPEILSLGLGPLGTANTLSSSMSLAPKRSPPNQPRVEVTDMITALKVRVGPNEWLAMSKVVQGAQCAILENKIAGRNRKEMKRKLLRSLRDIVGNAQWNHAYQQVQEEKKARLDQERETWSDLWQWESLVGF